MATASVTVTGAAAPDEVWRRYTHPSLWPDWSHHFSRTAYPRQELVPGLSGTAWLVGPVPLRLLLRPFGGIPAHFDVDDVRGNDVRDDVEPGSAGEREWRWRLHLGPVTMRLRHTVRPDPQGSATVTTISAPAPLLAGYLPVSKAALRRIVTP